MTAARPTGQVRVRRIRPDEAHALRDVRLRALADEPLAFGSTQAREAAYPAEQWAAWARDSADGPTQATYFATVEPDDGTPVGMAFAVVHADDATLAHLFAMWVAPEARGTGAGGALVARLPNGRRRTARGRSARRSRSATSAPRACTSEPASATRASASRSGTPTA
jgi:GNAT superfamily N-acetyltransferase